jgi:hypothetical protein
MPSHTTEAEAHRFLTMLCASSELLHVSEADPQEPRSGMKCWRLESETPTLFIPEDSGEALHIKDVVELSFLRAGSYAGSPEEHE